MSLFRPRSISLVALAAMTSLATSLACAPGERPNPEPNPLAPEGEPGVSPAAEPGVEPGVSPAVEPGVSPDPTPDGNPEPDPGPEGACTPATVAADGTLDGFQGDTVAWADASCAPREVFLVRPDVADPVGSYGGLARRFTYEGPDGTRVNTSGNPTHPGFGEVVTHYNGGAWVGNRAPGTWVPLFVGEHHVVYEYRWNLPLPGGTVEAIVYWTFATGRDHPLYSITYDATAAGPDAVNADSRSPYGDIQFDNDLGGDVEGLGWGDRYRFRTTDNGPVTFSSSWTYAEQNRIPHVLEWSDSANAEMGLVQTQEWTRKDAGGYWFYAEWGQTSGAGAAMPDDWNWTYQLNQYELPFTTSSHRIAWGTNYGAVGQQSYPVYGDDAQASGYPYQSYAVFIALGERGTVDAVVDDTEALQDAALSCSVGTARTAGPGGAGRTDSQPYAPVGFNPVYASFDIDADGGAATCVLDLGSRSVDSLMLRVHGATGNIEVDGNSVSSVDDNDDVTWVTLLGTRTGTVSFSF